MKSENLSKHTLFLVAGDMARLKQLYPDGNASLIIRNLLHAYLDKIDPKIDPSKIKGQVDV
jgi:hypothetical protein